MVRCCSALPSQQDGAGGMHKRELGQNLVEFALSLTVFLVVFLGVFDLGRAFTTYIIITNAAREGAWYGAMHPTDSAGIVAHVSQEAQGSGIVLTAANVTVSSSGVKGTPLQVTVHYDFCLWSFVVPGVSTVRLQHSAEMVIL
jgi:Flp pilus assembly protein TadG